MQFATSSILVAFYFGRGPYLTYRFHVFSFFSLFPINTLCTPIPIDPAIPNLISMYLATCLSVEINISTLVHAQRPDMVSQDPVKPGCPPCWLIGHWLASEDKTVYVP